MNSSRPSGSPFLSSIRPALFALLLSSPAWQPRAADRPSESALNESIQRIRMGTLVIHAAPNTQVRVEQVRHEFWFGAALANQAFNGQLNPDDTAQYRKVFLENFNAAVTENALKWHVMESRQGYPDYHTIDAILAWTETNQIPLRGHNIFWGIPNRVQPWLKQMDDTTLRATLKQHALDIARRYRGRFAEYDLNNEMLHGNWYAERLGPGITREMAEWVHEADPGAKLFLNDYDILTGRRLDDYAAQIKGFLAEGIPFAGVGVQGHLHGDHFDIEPLEKALDRLAAFDLPIRITEFNFPGQRSKYYNDRRARLSPEEEQAKAKAITDYYRLCFAHPGVEGILMWGFWERANWIPVSSLYQRDWSPTPAAKAYRDLVFHEWWTDWEGTTDARGQCELRAFYGRHRISAAGHSKTIDLQRADGHLEVTLPSE